LNVIAQIKLTKHTYTHARARTHTHTHTQNQLHPLYFRFLYYDVIFSTN